MIFYVAMGTDGRHHLCGTQAEAKDINREFEKIDVPTTSKDEMLVWVQNLLTRIDDLSAAQSGEAGGPEKRLEGSTPSPPQPEPKQLSYTEMSVAIDQAWDQLSLARQLHFAALAMESARETLPLLIKETLTDAPQSDAALSAPA